MSTPLYAVGHHTNAGGSTRAVMMDVRNGRIVATADDGKILGVGVAVSAGSTSPSIRADIVVQESVAAVPGAGVASPSTMVLWMSGDTIALAMNSRERGVVPDVRSGDDLILPGYIGYIPAPIRLESTDESTALRIRAIVDSIESHGIPVRRFVVAADPATKPSPTLLQMLANVLDARIKLAAAEDPAAVGAAILAALKNGLEKTGHASVSRLIHTMAQQRKDLIYRPDLREKRKYARHA